MRVVWRYFVFLAAWQWKESCAFVASNFARVIQFSRVQHPRADETNEVNGVSGIEPLDLPAQPAHQFHRMARSL